MLGCKFPRVHVTCYSKLPPTLATLSPYLDGFIVGSCWT